MHGMNNTRVDLNLLAVFDAVVSTGSVSAAAVKLNLSQPAVSHALNRLRKVTGDQLFVRSGQGLAATPHAESLRPRAIEILESARRLLTRPNFEPAQDRRTLRIAASDYAALTIVPDFLAHIRRAAPFISIDIVPVGGSTLKNLELGDISLSFWGAEHPGPPFETSPLFEEHFAGFAWKTHALAARDNVSLDDYLRYPHAVVTYGTGTYNPLEAALKLSGRTREIRFTGQSVSGNLAAMRETDLIMALPSRLAGFAKTLGFEQFNLPLASKPFQYGIIWHRRTGSDPVHLWVRSAISASIQNGETAR